MPADQHSNGPAPITGDHPRPADIQNGAVQNSTPPRLPLLPDGYRWVAHIAAEVRFEIRPGRRGEDDGLHASIAWESEVRSESELAVDQVVRMAHALYSRINESLDVAHELGIEVTY